MFEEHNKLTKTSYWLIAISSLIGFAFMAAILPQLTWDAPWISYALAGALGLMLALNTYFAYLIYKRSLRALKLCLWLYGLQIIGFETENWALSLNFGMNVSMSFVYNSTLVTINLLAIVIFMVILLAYRSVIGANKSNNYAPSAPDS
ncbi:hypothetical protein [Marinimicrobium sp. C2-29]|uniref:hypothetical protein n=1 Tax=Marinimicrobium sp. C2-29 TaxID=3139825 RepID=UPI0031389A2C